MLYVTRMSVAVANVADCYYEASIPLMPNTNGTLLSSVKKRLLSHLCQGRVNELYLLLVMLSLAWLMPFIILMRSCVTRECTMKEGQRQNGIGKCPRRWLGRGYGDA